MHDSRRTRLVLGVLLAAALALITVDARNGSASPVRALRSIGAGVFGSAEFLIYYGFGVFFTALLHDPRPMLAGCWAVAIMSHVSLLQRVRFAWKRYRFVEPGLAADADPAGQPGSPAPAGIMTDAEAS